LTYRLLTDAEKGKLAEIWPKYEGVDLSRTPIAGAVDESGAIRALAVLNWVPHCEPMWIDAGAPVDFRRLVRIVEENTTGRELWVFAPDDKIARMAEICGAKKTGYRVMRKELLRNAER
jgi:hypothetical protein